MIEGRWLGGGGKKFWTHREGGRRKTSDLIFFHFLNSMFSGVFMGFRAFKFMDIHLLSVIEYLDSLRRGGGKKYWKRPERWSKILEAP